eukprot:84852_1
MSTPCTPKQATVVILLWSLGLLHLHHRSVDSWRRNTIQANNKITKKMMDDETIGSTVKICQPQPLSNQPLSVFNKSGFWKYHNSDNCSSISCTDHSYDFETLSCSNTTHTPLNCIGKTSFDPILMANAVYRKHDCVLKTFTPQAIITCLSKHKRIAIIGDSTSWQQWQIVNHNVRSLYKRMSRRKRKHIRKQSVFGNQFSEWNDTTDPEIYFKFQFIGRGPKRIPTLTFLSEPFIAEFGKYWEYFHQYNYFNKDHKNISLFINNIHKNGKQHFANVLNRDKVETIIFNDNIHAVSFWEFYDIFIQNKTYDNIRLSFNWKQSRRQIYENAIHFFFANAKYLKRVYFWSGYKPPPTCHPWNERWKEFNDFAVQVVNDMNMNNVYYIDAGDIGASYIKGWNNTKYTDEKCHYGGIMLEMTFNALLTGLCPQM